MRTKDEIRSTLSKHRNHLFQAYPIKSMAIFGSYARNESTDNSDLDILVEFNDRIGIRFIDLADEIERRRILVRLLMLAPGRETCRCGCVSSFVR